MFDPSGITLGQISSSIRDFAIVAVLISVSWKARGAYEAGTQFFTRTMKHMDTMELGMSTLLSNHLAHIENSLDKMSNNQERVLSGSEAIHVIEEETLEN